MATTIKLKNSVTTTAAPSSLVQGEVATNVTDKKLWVGNAATTPVQLIGAGASVSFTDVTTSSDASISGLTVGKGGGAVATNTVIGNGALTATNTIGYVTAVGYQAATASTSGPNDAFGYAALKTNSTGSNNASFGAFSLTANSTGTSNVAVGRDALQANTTASNNTAVGYQAGYYSNGSGNSIFGQTAGYNSNGTNNTIIGFQAGYNVTGARNVIVGFDAGFSLTTGTANTFVGGGDSGNLGAGYYVTTGSKNTIIGNYSGNNGGLDIRTASNYIVLSDGDGNPRAYWDGSGYFYNHTTTSVTSVANFGGVSSLYSMGTNTPNNAGTYYHFTFTEAGTQRGSITSNGVATVYNTTSDKRLKENIVDATSALPKINAIQIRSFDWIGANRHENFGVIAQELKEVAPEAVTEGLTPDDMMSVDYSKLVPMLTKAIQELNADLASTKLVLADAITKLEAQALEIATLKGL